MADLQLDGNVKVSWVSTIASLAAPTAAELTAGISLEDRLTPDGLDISVDDETIDNTSMASTYSTEVIGRSKVTATIKYKASTPGGTDTVKDTLVYRALGFLVVRRGIASGTAFTSAQKVEVYPAQCGRPAPDAVAPNAIQTVTVRMASTATPRGFGEEAVVAA